MATSTHMYIGLGRIGEDKKRLNNKNSLSYGSEGLANGNLAKIGTENYEKKSDINKLIQNF